jgi:NRPS condensation-like uncharacterized protein
MYRKTTSPERYMFFFGNRYPICFSFMVRVKGRLTGDMLREALQILKRRHPLLAARIVMNEKKEQFITDRGTADFEIQCFPAGTDPWETRVLTLLGRPFPLETGPFVRFGLRERNGETEVYAVFHHSTADGVAGITLFRELFMVLSGDTPTVPVSDRGAYLFDALTPEVEAALSKLEKPSWVNDKPEIKGKAAIPPFAAPDFKIHTMELRRETVNGLLAYTKRAGLTVNALLGAVFLRSYADVFGDRTGYARTIQLPVDCRKYIKEEHKNAVGAFNSIIKMPIDCAPQKSISEIAAEIAEKLKENTSNFRDIQDFWHFNGFFDDVSDPEAMMCEFKPDPLDYDFSLSNLGRIDLAPRYGEWEIRSIFGPTFSAVHGEQVIGLNTHDGIMRFTYIYDKALFPEQTGAEIWESAFSRLRELLEQA